jgi:predicted negative regulator of RcsB-dependent stress response
MFESLRANSRAAILAIVGVAAVAGAVALYNWSKAKESVRADQALFDAQRTLGSGNLPQAQSELQKLATRYDGTSAAGQANILLAQVMYDQGKYADGLAILGKVQNEVDEENRPAVHALRAAGHEQVGKPAEAAAEYLKAAEASGFALDRANFQASAARAFMAAGNRAEALRLWTELARDPKGPVAGEARVRLGELTAVPAGKSSAAGSGVGTAVRTDPERRVLRAAETRPSLSSNRVTTYNMYYVNLAPWRNVENVVRRLHRAVQTRVRLSPPPRPRPRLPRSLDEQPASVPSKTLTGRGAQRRAASGPARCEPPVRGRREVA